MNKFSLIEHITNFMGQPRLGDPRHPTFWPSEGSCVIKKDGKEKNYGKCRRAIYLRYLTYCYSFDPDNTLNADVAKWLIDNSEPADRYMRWIWTAGELFEDHIINMCKSSGVFAGTQFNIYIPEYNVSGKIDIIAVDPSDGKLNITEVKSIHGYHAGKNILGSYEDHKKKRLGSPKTSHLIQVGIYQWHLKYSKRPEDMLSPANLGHARLLYGRRDTGEYGEYEVDVQLDGTLLYRPNGPVFNSQWTKSKVNIVTVLEDFKQIQENIDSGTIPPKDFVLQYSYKQLLELLDAGELNKTNTEKVAKIKARKEENKLLKAEGKKTKAELKLPTLGDWNCTYCDFQKACWDKKIKKPTKLS